MGPYSVLKVLSLLSIFSRCEICQEFPPGPFGKATKKATLGNGTKDGRLTKKRGNKTELQNCQRFPSTKVEKNLRRIRKGSYSRPMICIPFQTRTISNAQLHHYIANGVFMKNYPYYARDEAPKK